jgi:hypothetical protein
MGKQGLWVLLFGLLFRLTCQADTTLVAKPAAFSLQMGGAFIWAHKADVAHLAQSHPIFLQAEYHPWAWSNTADGAYYRNTRLGITGSLWNFRQKEVLGYAIPVMFSISNKLWGRQESGLHYRFCAGLAWCTKPFSATENTHNVAIASNILGAAQIGLMGKIKANQNGFIRAEAGLAHLSAGAFRLPNFGLNTPYVLVGWQQCFGSDRPNKRAGQRPSNALATWSYWVVAGAGLRQGANSYDPFRFSGNLRAEAWRRMGNRSALVVGAEGIYHGALNDIRANVNLPAVTPIRAGLLVGHEWLFYVVSVSTQVGVYVYNPSPQVQRPIYQRYGLRLLWNHRLVPAFFLRAHGGQADLAEFSLTYRLF